MKTKDGLGGMAAAPEHVVGVMFSTFHSHSQNGLWGSGRPFGACQRAGKQFSTTAQTMWVHIPVLPLPSSVTLSKSRPCSMPQFPLLYNGITTVTQSTIHLNTTLQTTVHLKELCRLNELTFVKSLAQSLACRKCAKLLVNKWENKQTNKRCGPDGVGPVGIGPVRRLHTPSFGSK